MSWLWPVNSWSLNWSTPFIQESFSQRCCVVFNININWYPFKYWLQQFGKYVWTKNSSNGWIQPSLLWLIWTILFDHLLSVATLQIHWPTYQINLLSHVNCRVIIYEACNPSKVSAEYWVTDRVWRGLQKDCLVWWAERKSNMMNSWPFVIWKQFVFFHSM